MGGTCRGNRLPFQARSSLRLAQHARRFERICLTQQSTLCAGLVLYSDAALAGEQDRMSQVRTQWPVEAAQPRYRQNAFVPSATSQSSQPQEVAAKSAASTPFPASHSHGGLSAQLKAHAKSSPPREASHPGGVAVCPVTQARRHV